MYSQTSDFVMVSAILSLCQTLTIMIASSPQIVGLKVDSHLMVSYP